MLSLLITQGKNTYTINKVSKKVKVLKWSELIKQEPEKIQFLSLILNKNL